MSRDRIIGWTLAMASVLMLVIAFRRMRSRDPKRKRYDDPLFSAWITAGCALGNLIPKLIYNAIGLSIFFAGPIVYVGWTVFRDHVARRNASK